MEEWKCQSVPQLQLVRWFALFKSHASSDLDTKEELVCLLGQVKTEVFKNLKIILSFFIENASANCGILAPFEIFRSFIPGLFESR